MGCCADPVVAVVVLRLHGGNFFPFSFFSQKWTFRRESTLAASEMAEGAVGRGDVIRLNLPGSVPRNIFSGVGKRRLSARPWFACALFVSTLMRLRLAAI